MATEAPEQTYNYLGSSSLTFDQGGANLLLATSGGRTAHGPAAHPVFFDGFLGHAEQAAVALLAVARVARTRFYLPPGMLAAVLRAADPVVTSNGDRLRFESFSACCGVYARFDALEGSLDGRVLEVGTTNVDFNPPMRDALSRVRGLDPLHLRVGQDVVVRTMEAEVTEKKVPLPERWLKGFAEVQLAAARAEPVLEVGVGEARRFLRGLPTSGGRGTAWVVPAGRGLRVTTRPSPEGVPLSGFDRLKPLEPLLRFATGLRAHAAGQGLHAGVGVWELQLADARFTLVLSPEASRGFSGEGAVLGDLADENSAEDADLVAALLAWEPRIDVGRLARESGLDEARVTRALGRLGAAGRVGWDNAEQAYFHRELPYDSARLESMHPRLRDAHALVAAGAVRLEDGLARVSSAGTDYVVRHVGEQDRCTCRWFAKYQGNRGPCKHVLAVGLVRQRG